MDKRYYVQFLEGLGSSWHILETFDSFDEARFFASSYWLRYSFNDVEVYISDNETGELYQPFVSWLVVERFSIAEEPSDVLH